MGDIRDPWGRPHLIDYVGPSSPSNRMCTVRLVVKDETHLTKLSGQPYFLRSRASLPGRTESKAPLTSMVSMLAVLPLINALYTSWVRHVVRSIADLYGRAPNCCVMRTLCRIAIQAMRLAKRRCKPLPRTESKAIGLYERGDVRSGLLGFCIITYMARRKEDG